VTDAHCHPTDLDISAEDYDAVKLGGICAMATTPEDQGKVANLGQGRPWKQDGTQSPVGPRVVSAFGMLTLTWQGIEVRISPMVHSSIYPPRSPTLKVRPLSIHLLFRKRTEY
jgi:hypothetical protein